MCVPEVKLLRSGHRLQEFLLHTTTTIHGVFMVSHALGVTLGSADVSPGILTATSLVFPSSATENVVLEKHRSPRTPSSALPEHLSSAAMLPRLQ